MGFGSVVDMDNAASDAASDAGTSATDVAPADEGGTSGASSSNSSFHTDQLEAAEAEKNVDPVSVDCLPDADASRNEQASRTGGMSAVRRRVRMDARDVLNDARPSTCSCMTCIATRSYAGVSVKSLF